MFDPIIKSLATLVVVDKAQDAFPILSSILVIALAGLLIFSIF